MSRIDELIQKLCPSGVEYMTLHELLGSIPRGRRLTKAALAEDGQVPVYHGGLEPIGFHDQSNSRAMTVMVINTGASSGTVGWSEVPFWCSDGCFALPHSERVESKYLYYFALSNQKFFTDRVRRAGIPTLAADSVLSLRIPVPPLEIQNEIVRVVDKFTELEADLEAELEAELEARRAQYEHYRDTLVSTHGGQWVKLADLGTFVRGRRFTKSDVVEVGIPSLHYGEIYTDYGTSATQAVRHVRPELRDQLRYALPGSVVFAGVGETVADVGKAVAWLGEEPIATHDDTFVFTSELDPKYVAYAVQTADFHRQKERHVSRAKVKRLSATGLGAIEIPVPSPKEQVSVVRSLDKFDALVNDISVGLPAELAARRKQYEHYRDRLLTFKELAS